MELPDLLNESSLSVLVVDLRSGEIRAFNRAAAELFGILPTASRKSREDVRSSALIVQHDQWLRFCRDLLSEGKNKPARIGLYDAEGRPFVALLDGIVPRKGDGREALVFVRPEGLGRTDTIPHESALVFEDPHFGVVQVRADGRLVAANRRALRMLECESWEELLAHAPTLASLYRSPRGGVGMAGLASDFGRGVERDLLRRHGAVLRVYETARKLVGAGSDELWELRWLDIDAYRELAEELALCQEKYRVLVEHSQDGVFITHQGLYVYVNGTYARMLGRRTEDMIGRPFMEFIAPEDRQRMAAMWRDREAGKWERSSYEMRLLHRKDGRRVLVSVRSGPIYYKGKLSSTGTIRDITEERRSAEVLQAVRRNYQEIFENLQIALFQTTADGRLFSANQACAHLLGYENVDRLLNELKNVRALYARDEDRLYVARELDEKGRVSGLEIELCRKEGRPVWGMVYGRLVNPGEGGEPHFEGALVDVTERRRLEQALARSEEFYRTLVEHGHVGVFLTERGCFTYVNGTFARTLGYDPGELRGLPVLNFVVPEQRRLLEQKFRSSELAPLTCECDFVSREPVSHVAMLVSVKTLVLEGRKIMVATAQDISAQRKALEELRFQSRHDPLTRLPNRTVFRERLQEAMEQNVDPGGPNYAVLFLDLDAFKLVNDTYGHLVGDQLLVEAAQRFEECLPKDSLLCSHGGYEFALLLARVSSQEDVKKTLALIEESLREPFLLNGQKVYTSVSIGIVMGGSDYTSPEDILRDADTAMYEAKQRAKGNHAFFDASMRTRVAHRLSTETNLRNALLHDEFEIVYQPIVALAHGRVVGFESLLRWRRADGSRVSPDAFLAIAEDIGLTLALNRWVLTEVVRNLHSWLSKQSLSKSFYVSFNLSHRQFFDPTLAVTVQEILSQGAVPSRLIRAEVTETVVSDHLGQARRIIQSLRDMGLSVALDDFGTGYSSFGYLRDLSVDALKIDRSFVVDIESNERTQKILHAIIALSRRLGMDVVAEGVETQTQVDFLQRFRCPCLQGYYFSPPVDSHEAQSMLKRTFNQQTKKNPRTTV